MRKNSILDRQPTPLLCSIVSAGTFFERFRASDAIFWYELFCDVLQLKERGEDAEVHPIQVDRLMQSLSQDGLASLHKDANKKTYSLHPHGLLRLLQQLTAHDKLVTVDEALLRQYFLDTHRTRIESHLAKVDDAATREFVRTLFEPGRIYDLQLDALDRVIRDSRARLEESDGLLAYLDREENAEKSPEEIIAGLPSEFSYGLSYRMSLKEWFAYIPKDMREIELDRGGVRQRREQYYQRRLEIQLETRRIFLHLQEKARAHHQSKNQNLG